MDWRDRITIDPKFSLENPLLKELASQLSL